MPWAKNCCWLKGIALQARFRSVVEFSSQQNENHSSQCYGSISSSVHIASGDNFHNSSFPPYPSPGVRVIYYFKKQDNEIWLLTIYSKSEMENIPAHILRQIRKEIEND
jgi:hypothetical protein